MPEPLPPDRRRDVGPYRLLGLLGSGGMGEVYLAVSRTAPPIRAAVKTIRRQIAAEPEFRVRFRREVAAVAAVSDPRLVALLDADTESEQPWLATEFVPAPTLAEVVRRHGPLPEAAVRTLGAELARGLAAVHRAGILHRDIKPGNVLVADGVPRLIDFGIAQAAEETALTASGLIIGTPGFMSPEQVMGDRALGAPSDVFSLAAVVCFAAGGRGPFEDDEAAAVLYRIARARADLTRLPAGLRGPLAAALAQHPGDRPDARELAALLTDGADRPAQPVSWPAGVRGLIAEHRESADRCVAADGLPGPTEWDTELANAPTVTARSPAATPTVGSGRTGETRLAPGPPARWGGKRLRALLGAAAALAMATVLSLTLPIGPGGTPGTGGGTEAGADVPGPGEDTDGTEDTDDGTGSDTGESGSQPESEDTGGDFEAVALPTVRSGGETGSVGNYGDQAVDESLRPDGWTPWQTELFSLGECSLSDGILVCRQPDWGVIAVDAADGTELWTAPAGADSMEWPGSLLVRDGEVLVPRWDSLTALDLRSGEQRWRQDIVGGKLHAVAADGDTLFTSVEYGRDLVIRAQAREPDEPDGEPQEIWSTGYADAIVQPGESTHIVRDFQLYRGQVYVQIRDSGDVVDLLHTLDAESGEKIAEAECDVFALTGGSVLCTGALNAPERREDHTRFRLLEASDLTGNGEFVHQTDWRGQFVVDDDGTLLVQNEDELVGYHIESGERRLTAALPDIAWEHSPRTARILIAGNQLVVVADASVHARPEGDPTGPDTSVEFDGRDSELVSILVSGGVFFLCYTGAIVSGELPT